MAKILFGIKKNSSISYCIIESDKSIVNWKTTLYDKSYSFFDGKELISIEFDKMIELEWSTAFLLDGPWMRYIDKHSYKLPYKLRDTKFP